MQTNLFKQAVQTSIWATGFTFKVVRRESGRGICIRWLGQAVKCKITQSPMPFGCYPVNQIKICTKELVCTWYVPYIYSWSEWVARVTHKNKTISLSKNAKLRLLNLCMSNHQSPTFTRNGYHRHRQRCYISTSHPAPARNSVIYRATAKENIATRTIWPITIEVS